MAVWPLKTVYISDKFGMRKHPIFGSYRMHNGLDFAAAGGTPLLAIKRMRLVGKGYNPGGAGYWGQWELVDEPSVTFDYWHQDRPVAHAIGAVVDEGGTVGYVGTTGTSTGNHLHLEMRHSGALRDPYEWLMTATRITITDPGELTMADITALLAEHEQTQRSLHDLQVEVAQMRKVTGFRVIRNTLNGETHAVSPIAGTAWHVPNPTEYKTLEALGVLPPEDEIENMDNQNVAFLLERLRTIATPKAQ